LYINNTQVIDNSRNLTNIGNATFSGILHMSKASDPKIYSNTGLNIDGAALYLNRFSTSNIGMCQGGGKVGIGTAAPIGKLEIVHDASVYGLIVRSTAGEGTVQIQGVEGQAARLRLIPDDGDDVTNADHFQLIHQPNNEFQMQRHDGSVFKTRWMLDVNNAVTQVTKGTAAATAGHNWYAAVDADHIVKVKDGNELYFEKESSVTGYNKWVFWGEQVGRNFDLSFRLKGGTPSGYRHFGIAIAGDGGESNSQYDMVVLRHGASASTSQIRIDRAGSTEQSLVSSSVPRFFDGTERHVLIQVRNQEYTIEVDGVLEHSFRASARTRQRGIVGFTIYEAASSDTWATIRNFKIKHYSTHKTMLPPTQVGETREGNDGLVIAGLYSTTDPALTFTTGHGSAGNTNTWDLGAITCDDDGSYNGKMAFRVSSGSGLNAGRHGGFITAMTIKNTGSVGIGTVAPGKKLDITGTFRVSNEVTLSDPNTAVDKIGDATTTGYRVRHSNLSQGIYVGYNTIMGAGSNANQDITIKSKGTGNLLLNSNDGANVGIGTTAPAVQLHQNVAAGNIVEHRLQAATVYTKIIADDASGFSAIDASHDLRLKEAGTEIVRITGGKVGINDSSPTYKLDVNGTGRFTGHVEFNSSFHIDVNSAGSDANFLMHNSNNSHLNFYSGNSSGGHDGDNGGNTLIDFRKTRDFLIGASDSTGLQNRANYLTIAGDTGNATFSGTITENSSIAIKENIFDFNTTLDKINRVRPVRYNKKTNKNKKEIGFIAEELAEIFPELVENDENGNPTSVNYTRAVAVLFDGFKQMYKELKEIKEKIK
jgi:hypothetical protein